MSTSSVNQPPGRELFELLLLMERRDGQCGAHHGGDSVLRYARQDRKESAARCHLGQADGEHGVGGRSDRVLAIDFHQHQLQGSSTCRSNLYAARCL